MVQKITGNGTDISNATTTGYNNGYSTGYSAGSIAGENFLLFAVHNCRWKSIMVGANDCFYNTQYINADEIQGTSSNTGTSVHYYAKETFTAYVYLMNFGQTENNEYSATLQVDDTDAITVATQNSYGTEKSVIVYGGKITITKGSSFRILNGSANSSTCGILLIRDAGNINLKIAE